MDLEGAHAVGVEADHVAADDGGDLGAARLQRGGVRAAADEAGLLGVEEAQAHRVVRGARARQVARDRQQGGHPGRVVVGAARGIVAGREAGVARRGRVEVAADDDEARLLAGHVGDDVAQDPPAEGELVRERRQADRAQLGEQRLRDAGVVGMRAVARAHRRAVGERRAAARSARRRRRRTRASPARAPAARPARARSAAVDSVVTAATATRAGRSSSGLGVRNRKCPCAPCAGISSLLVSASIASSTRSPSRPQHVVLRERRAGAHARVELDEQRILDVVAQRQAVDLDAGVHRLASATRESSASAHSPAPCAAARSSRARARRAAQRVERAGEAGEHEALAEQRRQRERRVRDRGPARELAVGRTTRSAATSMFGPSTSGGSSDASATTCSKSGTRRSSSRSAGALERLREDEPHRHVQSRGLLEQLLDGRQQVDAAIRPLCAPSAARSAPAWWSRTMSIEPALVTGASRARYPLPPRPRAPIWARRRGAVQTRLQRGVVL